MKYCKTNARITSNNITLHIACQNAQRNGPVLTIMNDDRGPVTMAQREKRPNLEIFSSERAFSQKYLSFTHGLMMDYKNL